MNNDDGERVKQMLGAVGSQTATVLRSVSNKAVEHGKVAMSAAQARMKQHQVMEYSYLDQDRNPQGPVSLDALLQLQAEGKVTAETPVMPLGGRVWTPLGTVINPAPTAGSAD